MIRQTSTRRTPRRLLAALAACALVVGACGGDNDDDDATPSATEESATDAATEPSADVPEETESEGTSAPATEAPSDEASSESSEAPAGDGTGTLRIGHNLVVNSMDVVLDPANVQNNADTPLLTLVFDTLMRTEENGDYTPGLAESFEVEDDLNLLVTLRDGLTFQDGEVLDAEALKYSIDRNFAAENTFHNAVFRQLASVEVVDPLSVRLTLATPQMAEFLPLLARFETMPYSQKAAEAAGEGFAKAPVGAGAFEVTGYDSEQKITMTKFADYWDSDSYNYAAVEVVHTEPGLPRINALAAGQIDLALFEASDVESLESSPDVAVETAASDGRYLYFNMCKSDPPFNDVKVRQALALAIDRDTVNDVVLGGVGEPMVAMVPSSSPFWDDSMGELMSYDPERAKELLAEAGYPDGLDVTFTVLAHEQAHIEAGELIQALGTEAGFNFSINPTPDIVATYYTNLETPFALTHALRRGLTQWQRAFSDGNLVNACNYVDQELIDTLNAAAGALDNDALGDYYVDLNERIMGDYLMVPIVWQPWVLGTNETRVSGASVFTARDEGVDLRHVVVTGD